MYEKSYSELITIPTFEERYRYLKIGGRVGETTFGFERYLNQILYNSDDWKEIRDKIIIRDNGCDLGMDGYEIPKGLKIFIHHINPITIADVRNRSSKLFDPENLITTIKKTHDAIHYGDESFLVHYQMVERRPNDTCPWKR